MKIRTDNASCKTYHVYFNALCVIAVFLGINISFGFAQVIDKQQKMYFISDFQAPLWVEKILYRPYRNTEARDSLFADIIRQRPKTLFLLGDMTSMGSDREAWTPLDTVLNAVKKTHTAVYAIPGNHEYMGKYEGMKMFGQRFPERWQYGYTVDVDSVAFVMLNSNFRAIGIKACSRQVKWYSAVMDSLDAAPGIKAIIVCIHHPPYSNSKVVGSSLPVADLIVPKFTNSKKSKLFISGHSHNLEYFSGHNEKHFLVIGGGGGIAQPLFTGNKRKYDDLLRQEDKPLYFYLVIEKKGNCLKLSARGFRKDFRFFESEFAEIMIN